MEDASASSSGLGHERVQELTLVVTRVGQFIPRLYGSKSHYYTMLQFVLETESFYDMHSDWYQHVARVAGILRSIKQDIDGGMIANFRNLLQAEVFSDFLEMAEHLLEKGYKDASAVLIGSVLEDSLRKISESNGIETMDTKGKILTMNSLNISLYKRGIYGPLIQKQITSWTNLRNDAAHGCYDKYDIEQTKQMLIFVQKFCSDHMK